VDRDVFWKAGAAQVISVAVLSTILAVALPKSFFESWGWISGPLAWLVCAALTARIVDLPRRPTLLGAALAGIPAAIAVLLGVHWLGVLIAVVLFSLWCARLSPRATASTG
jgi:hypothetical protein